MSLIRVVAQHAPNLFGLLGLMNSEECPSVIVVEGRGTYYRAETHDHYILYKAALSGWGAAAPNPEDARPVFDPRQR
jgi:hypothetical protein